MENKKSEIKLRLLQFIKNQDIRQDVFFKRIGMVASNFKSIGLNSELSADKISRILSEYRELNPIWLLTGQGAMYTEKIDSLTGRDYLEEIENWKSKYFDLLEKYNSCLENTNILNKKSQLTEKQLHVEATPLQKKKNTSMPGKTKENE